MRARVAALILLFVVTGGVAAFAQGTGDGAAAAPGHAWLVIRTDDSARLVHLPPRALSQRPAAPGSVRSARELAQIPTGCAAVGDRVYLAFRDGLRHSVLSGRAVEAVGGLWALRPESRLDVHPSIPEGTLVGFVGTEGGPVALLRVGGAFQILTLASDGWISKDVPDGLGPVAVVRWVNRAAVLTSSGELWSFGEADWQQIAIPPFSVEPGDRYFGIGAQIVSLREDGTHLSVRTLDAAGEQLIARLDGVPADAAMAPITLDGGRLAIVWREGNDDASYRMIELGVASGAILYDASPTPILPVSQGEFRVLAAVLVVVAVAVLIIAIRPSGAGELKVPPGMALAEPGRRFAATFIDLLIATFVVARVFGVSIIDIATFTVIFEPVGLWALPGVLGVGCLLGSASEAVFGRTLGKFLIGCRAVRGDGSGRGPGVWPSVVRNVIKWWLPPIPALALFEPDAPHRGDAIARVVVVVQVEARVPDEG